MAKFKVCYSGFAYVEAESWDEAEEKYHNCEATYEEMSVNAIELVEEFDVEVP